MTSPNYCTFVTLIVSLVILINLTGQLCQLVDSPLLMETSGSQSSSSSSSSSSSVSSSDSALDIGDLSSSSSSSSSSLSSSVSSPSLDSTYDESEDATNPLESKKKRYQPARYLVRPFWLNPKYTWKAFQMNSSRNEAKEEEIRKLRDKKRTKLRKLVDKMKKAALISKKLFLLLNEVSMNLDPELI